MARERSVYRCQECGLAAPKPGTCPDCARVGTYVQLVEERPAPARGSARPGVTSTRPLPLGDIRVDGDGHRTSSGMAELDRVLGGGVVTGSLVLIDRHYNDLTPYRKNEPNMYAVRKDGGCTVKYVEMADSALILRPHNQASPISVIQIEEGKTYADYIVGRVCHVANET